MGEEESKSPGHFFDGVWGKLIIHLFQQQQIGLNKKWRFPFIASQTNWDMLIGK